ncbi:MAG: ribonuclease HII [Candidatus Aenigmarchaeota archaeon]|nr:ribonuclease HII [Candidatus Aenigmarchaeota archaeon]
MKVLGIDEAGRGAVIGPMVLCGYMTDSKTLKKIEELGVKDSKELSPKRRNFLAKKLEKLPSEIFVLKIPPCKIDYNRTHGVNLNTLEAKKMAEIIDVLGPDIAIIDTPGTNTERFKQKVWSFLENKKVKLVCENFADKNYPIVSAASIIAKVERDKEIEELKKQVGVDFGVGYSHDPLTIKFIEGLVKKHGDKLPSYVRKTWDTTQQILKKHKQKSLVSFLTKLLKKVE